MPGHSDSAEKIICDFKQFKWDSKPFERLIEMTTYQPHEIESLLRLSLEEIPGCSTFLDAALSSLHPDAFPALVTDALSAFASNCENETGASIIAYTSLQYPQVLHPHLADLFNLKVNRSSYYSTWPWRESGKSNYQFLREKLNDPSADWREAWNAMLETRDAEVMAFALCRAKETDLLPDPESLLYEVGFHYEEDQFRQLYSNRLFHLIFDKQYWVDDSRPIWQQRIHPTWHLTDAADRTANIGGSISATCKVCRHELHHLLTLSSVPEGLGITGVKPLTLVTCLSCLGNEQSELFYKHNEAGMPVHTGYDGLSVTPAFKAFPIKPAKVRLVESPHRWCWQDWALSNGRENLHRLGGYPCWVQSADYLNCPECKEKMSFLMQLDSELPTTNNEEFLWGSGGIGYILWCDSCKVSGCTWQCT